MVTLTLATVLAVWSMCAKPAPEPQSFHSRGFGYVAEIFPPFSRQNALERPAVFLYAVGYPGRRWDVDARPVTSALLPHDLFPAEAVVSQAGHVVTLDDYHQLGQANAVVLVDSTGTQLGGYSLTDLLPGEEIETFEQSDCGIHWRDGARYFFLLEAKPRFYIILSGGVVIEFSLEDGTFRRGETREFPDLLQVMTQPFANEQVEPWPTSLRFSSITDLVRGR